MSKSTDDSGKPAGRAKPPARQRRAATRADGTAPRPGRTGTSTARSVATATSTGAAPATATSSKAEGGGESATALWRPRPGGVADQLLGMVGVAAELSLGLGRMLGTKPVRRNALDKAGAFLRGAREATGLTVSEVSAAIDLKDPTLLDLAESGKAALPFEVLLRLAAVLARNDPIPFLMQLARNYSPQLWRTLEQLGVSRLVLHAGREHEFINIYRSRDAARQLSDEQFAQVLAFTDSAFRMALKLVGDTNGNPERKPGG